MDGILLVNKPKNWTSHDVVAKIRNVIRQAQKNGELGVSHVDAEQGSNENRQNRTVKYGDGDSQATDEVIRRETAGMASSASQQSQSVRKIRVGHTGTLDPQADGLLILCIGKYTKKVPELIKQDKTYIANIRFGFTSTTGDAEGDILENTGVKIKVLEEEFKKTLEGFLGEQEQIPHQFSAVKINGKKAYELAREGKQVNIKPRKINVYSAQLLDFNWPDVVVEFKVSSGTYIRVLAEDIGEKLGVGAYLTGLHRTRIGKWKIDQAIDMDNINFKIVQNNIIFFMDLY